jgi:hypothetical protein
MQELQGGSDETYGEVRKWEIDTLGFYKSETMKAGSQPVTDKDVVVRWVNDANYRSQKIRDFRDERDQRAVTAANEEAQRRHDRAEEDRQSRNDNVKAFINALPH